MAPFDKIVLRSPIGDEAEVTAYGGHVLSWRTANGIDRLYLSPRSEFRSGAAIRGGVPVIFPQFSLEGPLPRHGFARTAIWDVEPSDSDDPAQRTFTLRDSEATRAIWPHSFVAQIKVRLMANALHIGLQVQNTGLTPLTFTAALHTYFQVEDIAQAQVLGLRGVTYRDSAAGGTLREEQHEAIQIEGEVDRIYLNAPAQVRLQTGPDLGLAIAQIGFQDMVVWNPGPERCAQLKDMPPDGYRHMLCIEAARIGQPVALATDEAWEGWQKIEIEN